MRLTAFHTVRDEAWSQCYADLVRYGVLVDVVTGAPSSMKFVDLTAAYARPILAFQGIWARPVVKVGVDHGWPVIGMCGTADDWHTVVFEGLVRDVDLFVFRDPCLVELANRNVNHVVVTGQGDAGVLGAVLRNLARHYTGQHDAFAKRVAKRDQTLKLARKHAFAAHGVEPSFLEAQFFADALHGPRERETTIQKLPTLLGVLA